MFVALNTYIKLISNLKLGDVDRDGIRKFYLDTSSGPAPLIKSGGFGKLYQSINVPMSTMNKSDQDRCIFPMRLNHFTNISGSSGKELVRDATEQVSKSYNARFIVKAVHVLFQWNAHSFFTYHQDDDGDVTVIINLSHGTSNMHVAGCALAEYDGIGSARMFPSKVFHRSGEAPRRCVKVALFFERKGDLLTSSSDQTGPPSSTPDPASEQTEEEEKREEVTS